MDWENLPLDKLEARISIKQHLVFEQFKKSVKFLL